MNVQNKLYTIQFFSLPDDQLRSQFPNSDDGTCRSCQTREFQTTRQIHGNKTELTEEKIPTPWSFIY